MSKKKAIRHQKKAVASTGSWQRVWNSLSDSRQHLVCAGILVVISIGFFASIHFSSDQLIAGDTIRWRSMANDMIEYEESTGEAALWSTNSFGGMPGFMISYPIHIPQIDIVPNTLRKFLWPSSHMIVLLLGMYVLVWILTSNKLAAVFAAVSYGLTTYMPVLLLAGHNTKFIALAWAPWLILAFLLVLRTPGWKSALVFSILAAVNLRAGHVQITYYVVIICGVWWLSELIFRLRRGETKTIISPTLFLLAGTGIALLMLAQPYWAFSEYKPFTIRGAVAGGEVGGLSWEYAMAWSQGFSEMLTLLVANAFGGASPLYWGPKTFTGGPHYLGGLTFAFVLYAIMTDRSVPVVALWVSGVLMIMFALGQYLPIINKPAFDYLPFFSTIRVPETWLSAVALNASILGGIGVARAVKGFSDSETSRASGSLWDSRLVTAFAIPGAIVLVLLLVPDLFLSFEKPGEDAAIFSQLRSQVPDVSPDDPRVSQVIAQEMDRRYTERSAAFSGDAQRTLFFLATGFMLFYLMRRRKVLPWLTISGLIVLVTFDLGGVGGRFINGDNLSTSANPEEAVPRYAFDNYLMQRVTEAGGTGHFRVLSLEMGQRPETNARPSNFYESLGGYSGAKLRSYQDFLEQILISADGRRLNPNALAIMNVRFVVGQQSVPGYELVYQDDATAQSVFENSTIPDRAYLVGNVETVEDAEATWERLRDDSFDPTETVIFSETRAESVVPIDSLSTTSVTLLEHNNRNIAWEVETDAPRWLVVSEVYYPAGWSAEINGEATEIVRANYLNRAVHIPAGKHRISMRFDPVSHAVGVTVASVSTLIVYLLLGLLFYKEYRSGVRLSAKAIPETELDVQ